MKKRCKNGKSLLCWFFLYYIDIRHKNHIVEYPWKIELYREEYITLLTVLLKHPEITFQELPCYIPYELYKRILICLRFPAVRHSSYPDHPRPRSNPIGIDMVSLQEDVQAIAGDEPYSFSLYSYTNNFQIEYKSLLILIWMKKMEVRISYTINKQEQNVIYGMIDVESVKKSLRVKTYKGIESSLCRYCNKTPKEQLDLFWLVRWLDNHGIKYVHTKDIFNRIKSFKVAIIVYMILLKYFCTVFQ